MSNVYDWNTNPAGNQSAPPHGLPEGMASPAVNDAVRQIMADVRKMLNELPWLELCRDKTITRVSDTQFRVEGFDALWAFPVGRVLKLMSGASPFYCEVASAAFATNTSVTVLFYNGTVIVPSPLNQVLCSVLSPDAQVPTVHDLDAFLSPPFFAADNLVGDGGFEGGSLAKFQVTTSGGT